MKEQNSYFLKKALTIKQFNPKQLKMKAINYFGTSMSEHGHYMWIIENELMQKTWQRFDHLAFNPESLTNTLYNGDIALYRTDNTTVIAICGSCKDDRSGSKSVFWVNENISYLELKQLLFDNPITNKIIESFKFNVKWSLIEKATEPLSELSKKIEQIEKEFTDEWIIKQAEEKNTLLTEVYVFAKAMKLMKNIIIDRFKINV